MECQVSTVFAFMLASRNLKQIEWTRFPGEVCLIQGLYIIRVNHSLKGTLNEDEPRVLHQARAGVSLPNFLPFHADRRWTCPGDLVNLIPFFPLFSCTFDTLNAIRALRAGWLKIYHLRTRFYLCGWCTGPNETYPPGQDSFYYVMKMTKFV